MLLVLDSGTDKAEQKGNKNVSGFKKNKFDWMAQQSSHKAWFSSYQIWQIYNNVGPKRL
jgi:hypothetical protein